LLGACFLVCG